MQEIWLDLTGRIKSKDGARWPMSSLSKMNEVVEVTPALQDRSRKKLDRLLKAGLMLIEQNGYDNVRIGDIAEEAGCSVGTFYERFGDKENFFNYLLATSVDEGVVGIEDLFDLGRWDGISADIVLFNIIDQMTQWFYRRKGLYCAALNRRSQERENFRPFAYVSRTASAALARFLRSRTDEFSIEDPEATAAFAIQMINSAAVLSALTESSGDATPAVLKDSTLLITDPEFARQLTKAVCAYLGLSKAPEALG